MTNNMGTRLVFEAALSTQVNETCFHIQTTRSNSIRGFAGLAKEESHKSHAS